MNIAFIVNNYPPRMGGVELHVRALAHELTKLGHKVTVVTLGTDLGWRDDDGVSVLTLREHFRVADILGFPAPGTRRKLSKLLKSLNVDVVSVHTRFFPMSFVGWRAGRSVGIPVIHTEHGSDHVSSESAVIRYASRAVDYTAGRAVLRGAAQVLGVSEAVTDFVRRLAGVDAEVFYNAIAEVSGTDGTQEQRPAKLAFVGRIVPGKGWDTFLEIVESLRAEEINVSGVVLGDGPDLEALRRKVSELRLDDVVELRGRVPQDVVRTELRGATLVNPTTLSEGFQTTLLEAIAEGGSVVTYPVPGASKLADAGAPVRISKDRSAVSLLNEVRQQILLPMKPADETFIHSWTWPARAQEYVDLCASVITKTKRDKI